jgi:hypothetical protein
MLSQFPARQNMNNGILQGTNAMPMKDGVSSGGNMFSMNRRTYARMPSFSQMREMTQTEEKQKKWYGNSGSRDASSVARSKNASMIGYTSKNTGLGGQASDNANVISYTTHRNINDTRQATQRTRNSGSTVPPKKRFQGMDRPNIFQ